MTGNAEEGAENVPKSTVTVMLVTRIASLPVFVKLLLMVKLLPGYTDPVLDSTCLAVNTEGHHSEERKASQHEQCQV